MAKSYKLEDGNYIDDKSVIHSKNGKHKSVYETLEGTVLYNNSTGSGTSITLSESAENFDCLEIYFAGEQGSIYNYNFLKINNPNDKQITLLAPISGVNNLYFIVARGIISETNISLENNRRVYFTNNGSAIFDNGGMIYITKVIGYK